MSAPVKGYVLEAQHRGWYYHRTGKWIQYAGPENGYVWTPTQLKKIVDHFHAHPDEWRLPPAVAHEAVYDEASGVTEVIGHGEPVNSLNLPTGAATVPSLGGDRFVIEAHRMSPAVSILGNASSL